jgi:enoyl-CoA hydratase/carnithine racemase
MLAHVEYTQVSTDLDRGVLVITLQRPELLNAWTTRMGLELSQALSDADADDDVRVVVLTGAGRAFCAGADLSQGGATFASDDDEDAASGAALVLPWQIRKPVIAAINGHAVGVGITLPLCADVRYVADDAKVQFAFVRRGMVPELAAHLLLARVAGLSVAADLLLSGRMVSGRELVELGVASRALPAAEVLPAAVAWARDVADYAAPVSVALTKQLLWADLRADLRSASQRETQPFAWIGRQRDAHEGIVSFLDKRVPEWSMRVGRDLPTFPDL